MSEACQEDAPHGADEGRDFRKRRRATAGIEFARAAGAFILNAVSKHPPGAPIDATSKLVAALLAQIHATQAEAALTRDFDFTTLSSAKDNPELFARITRRLKIQCGLNPWPEAICEEGEIYLTIGRAPLRFKITFEQTPGTERTIVSIPEAAEEIPSADELRARAMIRKRAAPRA